MVSEKISLGGDIGRREVEDSPRLSLWDKRARFLRFRSRSRSRLRAFVPAECFSLTCTL